MNNSYEAIIFDFGGVIIDLDYNLTVQQFKNIGISDFENIYSQASQSELFSQLETGQISGEYFIKKIQALLPDNITATQVVDAWNAMIKEIPLEKLLLLKRLKQEGVRTFLLSNTNEIHIPFALKKLKKISNASLESYFEKVYFSHDLKMRKPDEEIFRFVCENNNLNPKNTLFIDDSIQHIQGAQNAGLNTLHLTPDLNLLDYFS